MNELMIRPENLPSNPIELSKIAKIGKEYVAMTVQKVKSFDKLEVALDERKKTLKQGQDAAILLFEIYRKIAELARDVPQGQNKPEIIHNENGKIIDTIPRKSELDPKWKRVGLSGLHELSIANKILKHNEIVYDVINESLLNDDIPTIGKFRSKLNYKHNRKRSETNKRNYKEDILFNLNKILTKIKNMSMEKDEYFLNKVEKIIEKIIKDIKDKKMTEEWKKNGKVEKKQEVKRLI